MQNKITLHKGCLSWDDTNTFIYTAMSTLKMNKFMKNRIIREVEERMRI